MTRNHLEIPSILRGPAARWERVLLTAIINQYCVRYMWEEGLITSFFSPPKKQCWSGQICVPRTLVNVKPTVSCPPLRSRKRPIRLAVFLYLRLFYSDSWFAEVCNDETGGSRDQNASQSSSAIGYPAGHIKAPLMAPSRGKLPPQQAADAYAISWLGYFKSRELERAFRIEYHRHTWLRRFWSSVALLAVQAWFLGQYYVRNLATPTIQAMLIVNLAFLLLQFLLETSLLLSRYQSKGASTPSKRGLYERLAGSGFLDFLWCCTITFAVTALDVTVFNLCSDPALSLRAPFACAAYKISTLPSAPFVICTGAAALVPLLSVAIIPNLAAVLAAFGLTAAQWAVSTDPERVLCS